MGDRGQDAEVVVVGGGAMGSATAWALARQGVRVVLLERFEPGHVRGASHGVGRIFRLGYADPLHVRLAQHAHGWWDVLQAESGEQLLTLNGCVDHGPAAALRQLTQTLTECDVPFEYLTAREAHARWPGMRFDDRVVFQPVAGRAHADRTVATLQSEAVRHGAQVRHGVRVLGIDVVPDGVVVRVAAEAPSARGGHPAATPGDVEELRAATVVVAAGAWSEGLLAGVPGFEALASLVVTQEQPAHFPVRDAALVADDSWPSFIHHVDPQAHAEARGELGADDDYPALGVYGHHTPGVGIKVGHHGTGPVVDPDARDFAAEPMRLAALREYVDAWFPGVDSSVPEPVSCTYTTTPDGLFVLDRVGPVVVGGGFSGHGFKFTPGIGQVLAALATGAGPNVPGVDLGAFSLARFAVEPVPAAADVPVA
ncbi:FAD-dependent oxidoreductase [Cellulomonas sp. P22]|uniref:FAD-dependent oxidoreductase n=1 Tax=Cellulomonas sp. P22 TaxID=3373189 RepID=UPI0037A788A4